MPNFIDDISPKEVKLYAKNAAGVGFVDGFPKLMGQSGVPVIIVPNGTVATNGTITLGTALDLIYANAWIYLPAGAVVGGLAGLYFCQFASTTVGQVFTSYDNATTEFIPRVISSGLVAAVGSNSAYTQATTVVVLAVISIPGGAMGANGSVTNTTRWALPNNSNNKRHFISFGSTNVLSIPLTTTKTLNSIMSGYNRGVVGRQNWTSALGGDGDGYSNNLALLSFEDTASTKLVYLKGQLTTATDYIVLEAFRVEVRKA